jgi:acetyl esterase/lipase
MLDLRLTPWQIYIAGDSAGANLAIGLMAHLSHPHPAAPRVELAEEKLGGVYLISPWVSFNTGSISTKTNQKKDYLSCARLKEFSNQFVGTFELDGYNMPLSESPSWWQGLQVHNLCVVGGEYEIFLTDIEDWTAAVKVMHITPT